MSPLVNLRILQGYTHQCTAQSLVIKYFRFGIQGSGVKYNAHSLWKNWTDVTNWVCSYIPITSVLIYDCIPEVVIVMSEKRDDSSSCCLF